MIWWYDMIWYDIDIMIWFKMTTQHDNMTWLTWFFSIFPGGLGHGPLLVLDCTEPRRCMMRRHFKVRFAAPNPAWRDHATTVINFTYQSVEGQGGTDEGTRKRRALAAENLLNMLNGDWRSTAVTHYCRLGCCRDNEALRAAALSCHESWCMHWVDWHLG